MNKTQLKSLATRLRAEVTEIERKAKAEGRSLTETEMDKLSDIESRAKSAKEQFDRDESILAQVRELTGIVGDVNGVGGSKAAGRHGTWAKEAAERITRAMPTTDGQKALVSGTVGVPNVIDPTVSRIGIVPTSILDLLPITQASSDGRGGNTFSFLRQTVRTNNAAPVADSALKPTSVYTLAEIEERFRVIAHLSEPTPQRYFTDHNLLEDFLLSEMEYGLERALETQVVSGDGTGENFTGILSTSGIVSVAFATDLLTTARKAITAMQANGTTPTAFVFNPADAEAFDLIREGTGTGQYLLGGPGTKADQTLWSIPRVASTSVAAGTALLADWSQAELVVREGATAAIDTSGENFTKNLATMRVEGRFGLAVKRPSAFAVLDLTAV